MIGIGKHSSLLLDINHYGHTQFYGTATSCQFHKTFLVSFMAMGAYPESKLKAGNTKGGSITVQLTSCSTGLESAV